MFIDRFIRFLPKSNLKKAIEHFNRGEHRRACREFEEHMKRMGNSWNGQDQELVRMYMVESYIEYARKLDDEGDMARAAEELEKAVALQPSYADVHFGLAKTYEKMGKRANSRESLKRALAVNPSYFKARVMLSRSYWLDGKYERSMEEIHGSLSYAPTFFIEKVKELEGMIREEPSNEDVRDAFRMLLEERPSSSQVSKQLALESIQNGDYDYAMTELKKALSMHSDYPDLHNLLGIAYANTGMVDDAVIEFETALKINPDYLKARLNLALTYYEKNIMDQARVQLEKILELDPENDLARNLMNEIKPVSSKR